MKRKFVLVLAIALIAAPLSEAFATRVFFTQYENGVCIDAYCSLTNGICLDTVVVQPN